MNAIEVNKLLRYEPVLGTFYWKESRGPMKAGTVAGGMLGEYYSVGIFKRNVLAHRLAVLCMTGEFPSKELTVDHIDGDKLNNAWANLRVVSRTINNQNLKRARIGSRSGLLGAHWNQQERKWQAAIRIGGKTVYLGRFDTPEAAHQTYLAKKREVHDGCTI